jgi:hypothetical protein
LRVNEDVRVRAIKFVNLRLKHTVVDARLHPVPEGHNHAPIRARCAGASGKQEAVSSKQ